MSSLEQSSVLNLVSSFLGDDNNGVQSDSMQPRSTETTQAIEFGAVGSVNEVLSVKVVVFSKDRPWQLQQLFRSMCLGEPHSGDRRLIISFHTLLHITDKYREAYGEVLASVQNELSSLSNVSLICYEEDTDNASSFESLFQSIIQSDEEGQSHWMFLTDDCILLLPLAALLEAALSAFSSNPNVQCFLSRLHPGITWAQTRALPSPPPRSFLRYYPTASVENGVYVYPLDRGCIDWAYPWDLSGGVYRNSVVKSVLKQLQDSDAMSHPNRIEIAGNQAIATVVEGPFLVAVPTCPVLLILAINRVQDVCQAPLACPETDALTLSPEALLKLYLEHKNLDLDRYRAAHFNSSHVGVVFLLDDNVSSNKTDGDLVQCTSDGASTDETFTPALSVLIPVHTGPPDAAAHAMRSIVMQPVEEFGERMQQCDHEADDSERLTLSPMQIVLVDDRCSDGSIGAMMSVVEDLGAEFPYVNITMKDRREANMPTASEPSHASMSNVKVEIVINIVSSPKPGVAIALNHGLSYCQAELVARMDADDVAAAGRLQQQVAALRFRIGVDVVGSDVILFRDTTADFDSNELVHAKAASSLLPRTAVPYSLVPSAADPSSTVSIRTSLPPTDAGFAGWAMLFSCSIAHPSVVFRKRAVIDCGGYDESYSYAEDYKLWLRMTMWNCSSLVSIPRVGLWHRKHRSRPQHASKQAQEALRASVDSMADLLRGSDTDWSDASQLAMAAKILRKPDTAPSLGQLDEAARLLIALEGAFLCQHGKSLTPRETALIQKDCDERIGELATLAVDRTPSNLNDSYAWRLWNERCPDLTLNRIALLCHHRHSGQSI